MNTHFYRYWSWSRSLSVWTHLYTRFPLALVNWKKFKNFKMLPKMRKSFWVRKWKKNPWQVQTLLLAHSIHWENIVSHHHSFSRPKVQKLCGLFYTKSSYWQEHALLLHRTCTVYNQIIEIAENVCYSNVVLLYLQRKEFIERVDEKNMAGLTRCPFVLSVTHRRIKIKVVNIIIPLFHWRY